MKGERLAGKVAVITGAANGIGEGCTALFRENGAQVIAIDRAIGPQTGIVADLTDEASVQSAVDAIAQQTRKVDVLINAAAFAHFAWIEEMTLTQWRQTLMGELDIVFLLTRALWPLMKQSGSASIINFASANARHALPGSPALAHCAGKGGVLAITRQLAMEGAPFGIRANTIAPGFIETTATRAHVESDPAFKATVLEKNMIKRLGQPNDIAQCAVWLGSDESSYVTGADIAIDGGATAW